MGRRFLVYFSWSRPAESEVELGKLHNRYPTLFEFRRAIWPGLAALADESPQDIRGFLDHVILSDFEVFARCIREVTGNDVQFYQRVLDDGRESPLTGVVRSDFDTIIVVSLDHFRTGQAPTDVEVEVLREFLRDESKCLVVCPHHDIGKPTADGSFERQVMEYRHHGDGLIPPQQRIGGFAIKLLAALGYPIENRFGLSPGFLESGEPALLQVDRDADADQLLTGVTTFNRHPHLPHLHIPEDSANHFRVLARQPIRRDASRHPFTESGQRFFNAMLQVNDTSHGGNLLICDATLWSSAFGGVSSLTQLWKNLAAMPLR